MLKARLSGLIDASLQISQGLDLKFVLHAVVDSARSLTSADYGAILTFDAAGQVQELHSSGFAAAEHDGLEAYDDRELLTTHVAGLRGTVRLRDLGAYIESTGVVSAEVPIRAFAAAEICTGDTRLGIVCVGHRDAGREFVREDEQTLTMLASQATLAIANAHRYGTEQRAKADLESLVNTSPIGVLVVDAGSGSLVTANRELTRILGVSLDPDRDVAPQMRQLTFRRIDGSRIPDDDLPGIRALRAGESVRAEELIIERTDGERVTSLVNATPIHSAAGEVASIVITVQDITPLEELERLRAEFLGMVSHELRAPLASIKGSAATARAASFSQDPAEARQFFRIIEEQADQMRGLINDLLDLTRIETGTLSVAPESADIAPILEDAKNVFLSSGHRNVVEIEVMSALPRVWADRQRLVQVLLNLLSNAAKHSREWSTIRVAASLRDLHVAVDVEDEGVGIAANRLPRLFSKFSGSQPGAVAGPGTYGLGLAICRGIVEAHGGRIWAESEGRGRGTTVRFTIPVYDAAAPTATTLASAHSDPAPTRLERILMVDDDPQMLRYVRRTLVDGGYAPILTADPNELGSLLRTEKPDLVLLNLVLPNTDGFELMRNTPGAAEVPVIFVSGRGGDRYVAEAFELGAADYVLKPFSPTELLTRISAALRRQAAARHAEPIRMGDLVVDCLSQRVTVAGQSANLTPTEYRLLLELCNVAGRVLTYDQILERVWDSGARGDARRVRTCVKDLRRKLGDDARNPTYIFTESGVGYRIGTSQS